MFQGRVGWTAAALVAVTAISCTPYPVYNSSDSRPNQAAEDPAEEEEANPSDFVPAEEAVVESRQYVSTSTTIDPRLFRRIVDTYLDTPYKRGGDNLRGIDCSHLVSAIYRDYDGTAVPDNTRGLFRLPVAVEEARLQVGDLVFFNFASTRSPSHVGVFLGGGKFVHASETEGVTVSSLDDDVYRLAYRGARRIAPALHTGE